jgi:type VI secretion system protein ImpG
MRDELKKYYDDELSYLRQMGAEFAEKYPKIAGRLLLDPSECRDPHVERLLEGFAFLAARIHLKIDDDFPEIVQSLLEVVYPHFLRPVPSMSIAEFSVDPERGKLTRPIPVPRNTVLYSRAQVDGVQCKFRTCYDTAVLPVRVSRARWTAPERLQPPLKAGGAVAACSIELSCFPDVEFSKLGLAYIDFFLNGESTLIHTLYELLFNNCAATLLRNPDDPTAAAVELSSGSLRAKGFADDESVLPFPRRSFTGYRLMQEYLAFPEKYFFVRMSNLEALASSRFTNRAELVFLISPFERADRQQSLELGVSEATFKPGCSPIVNLFSLKAEPLQFTEARLEQQIIPSVRRPHALEIFSVDEVLTSSPERKDVTVYEPFYSNRNRSAGKAPAYWHATRRPSPRPGDSGTEVYLSLVDGSGSPAHLPGETLAIACTCSNRDLPERLRVGNEGGDFELEGSGAVKRIVCLRKPTSVLRPPLGRGLEWRLVSHLSLNYLSLVEEGRGALQQILRVYNFSESRTLDRQISGISALASRRHSARVVSEHGISFARGLRVDMEFDEEFFDGGGVFLFASVLERFLGLYASLNSFTQLTVRTRQRKEVLREWPPRAGQKILL